MRTRARAERLAIFRPASKQPLLVQNAPKNKRPFIHPILAPDGVGELTENEPSHHPWQHGLYVGLNDVNGYGFWTEGLTQNPLDGTFHPKPLDQPIVGERHVAWKVETAYRAPDGNVLLTETQAWTLEDHASFLLLDVRWTLRAATHLHFGQHAYGGLFLRMPWRPETHGELLTSEAAITARSAEAQRARWVAVSMPILARHHRTAGLAFYDHPANPGFPSPWRVDDNLGIGPSRSIAGSWQLAAGDTVTNRHRLLAFAGTADAEFIGRQWQQFSVA